eukprot:429517-Amorphochlora_amoeboformis.AAC.1
MAETGYWEALVVNGSGVRSKVQVRIDGTRLLVSPYNFSTNCTNSGLGKASSGLLANQLGWKREVGGVESDAHSQQRDRSIHRQNHPHRCQTIV